MLEPAEGVKFRQTSDTYELVFEDGEILSKPARHLGRIRKKLWGKTVAVTSFRRENERYRYYMLWSDGTVTEEGSTTCECGVPVAEVAMTKNDYEAEAARLALRTRDGRFALVRAMHQKVNEQDVEECLNELLNQFPNDKFIGSDFVSHTFECQKCSDWIEVGANTYRGPAFIARIDVVAQERNRASDAQRGVSLGYYTPGDVN